MKTLIVYDSKYGATEKCVNLLKEKVTEAVDVVRMRDGNKVTLDAYDTIIIGSSIYAGKMRPSIVNFVKENDSELRNKNIGVLLCCKDEGEEAIKYINENLPSWVEKEAFIKLAMGHEINLEKMNFAERSILKLIFKVKKSYSKIDTELINKVAEAINEL